MGRPRKVVSRVGFDGLEETKGHPGEGRDQVQITCEVAPDERTSDGACAQDHDLDRVSVLGSDAKGCRPFVVEFVDVFVEGAVVKSTVSPVVEKVLKDKEEE